jgi:hypothetical protein
VNYVLLHARDYLCLEQVLTLDTTAGLTMTRSATKVPSGKTKMPSSTVTQPRSSIQKPCRSQLHEHTHSLAVSRPSVDSAPIIDHPALAQENVQKKQRTHCGKRSRRKVKNNVEMAAVEVGELAPSGD